MNVTLTRVITTVLLLLLSVSLVAAQEEAAAAAEHGPAGLDMLLLLVGVGALGITGFIFFSREQAEQSDS